MPPASSSRVPASKSSASAAFSSSKLTSSQSSSSILRSAFAPANLQLSLFASTIRSLATEQLRVHDTVTGDLKSAHTVSGSTIHCIRWGSFGHGALNQSGKTKKRKLDNGRSAHSTGGSAVIAIGTDKAEIEIFSPLEGRVIAVLKNAHDRGTKDFVFQDTNKAWSLGLDGTLIEWDLDSLTRIQSFQAPAPSLTRLVTFSTSLLLASQSTYLYNPTSQDTKTIPCFDQPIHTIIPQSGTKKSPPTQFLAAASSKATIGVYSVDTLSIIGNLNASDEVQNIALFSQGSTSLLASVSKLGEVELFDSPFEDWLSLDDNIKSKRRKATRRSNATVEIRRPDKSNKLVPVVDATIDSEGILILAVAEGAVDLGFERLSVLNDNQSLALTGVETIKRAKNSGLVNESMNGVKDLKHAHIDESKAIISHGMVDSTDVVEDEDPDGEDISQDEQDDEGVASTEVVQGNETTDVDIEMADANDDPAEDDDTEEPTFGDLIRARGINAVEVSDPRALVSTAGAMGPLSSNLTLATLLTQALNTNDSASLDTCLAQQDLQIIRATIERLDSGLAVTLLHRLAERLHSRPGRAGSLLVWVQWTIVAHGGYLSSRPDTVKQLQSLHKVVQERAKSLQPLLALKGKLDMLDAQIAFRKKLHQTHVASVAPISRPEDMIYVEGQPESDTEDDQVDDQAMVQAGKDMSDEEAGEDDEEDVVNGDDAEEEQEEAEESEDLGEASATDLSDEDVLDGEVDHDDLDPEDSDTSDDGSTNIRGRQVNGIKP